MANHIQEDRPTSLTRSERPVRVSINGYRDLLVVRGQEPGWHYIWVDDPSLSKYEMGGYDYVTHEVVVGDKRVNIPGQIGGKVTQSGGNGITLFLMRCPEEVYQDELRIVHQRVDESEGNMKEALNSTADGRYGKVKIEESKPVARKA